MKLSTNIINKCKKIKLLVLDVDGVLTDGKLYFGSDGTEYKAFNTLDGHGLKMLQASGVKVGIITGRKSMLVEKRARNLGITLIKQGREDKDIALTELLNEVHITLEEIAFMGDDYPDLLVMTKAGLAVSVPNGANPVKERADIITLAKGGDGAVREICDTLMQAQNTFNDALNRYI